MSVILIIIHRIKLNEVNGMKTMAATKLFVDDGGKDSSDELPIVFLHSLAGNTQQWAAQLRHVRPIRRAIALDLRGHGQSAAGDGYAIETMAQDVQATLAELGIERFILVGHSMGGSVAVAYAGKYPQQVAGLLLVDPSGDSTQMPAEQVQGLLGALQSPAYTAVIEQYWQQILAGATDETQAQVMRDMQQTEQATVVGVMQALFSYNPTPALQNYEGQRLSVITPLNEVPFALHNLGPDLPHKLIEGTSHWLHMDKPAQFNQILDAFYSSL
jgi:pimeloyl-ACP methyl ester carboxylesterase